MPPTPQDIINYAEEFALVPLPKIQLFIDYAYLSTGAAAEKWDHLLNFATLLLACHLLTGVLAQGNEGQQNVLGPISMQKVGDLQTSYSAGQINGQGNNLNALGQTVYGQEFLRLQRSLVITPLLF